MKKMWQKPELVLIFRGRSEEAVLTACKTGAAPDSGSQTIQAGGACIENLVNCDPCVGLIGS